MRTRAAAHFRAAFRRCTVIVTPTCPTVAPRIRAAALQGGEAGARTPLPHQPGSSSLSLTRTVTNHPSASAFGPHADVQTTTKLMRFMVQANMLGLPALTAPVGAAMGDDRARGGSSPGPPLPVGLQLIGEPWDEATLLRVGAALDAAQGEVLPLPAEHY